MLIPRKYNWSSSNLEGLCVTLASLQRRGGFQREEKWLIRRERKHKTFIYLYTYTPLHFQIHSADMELLYEFLITHTWESLSFIKLLLIIISFKAKVFLLFCKFDKYHITSRSTTSLHHFLWCELCNWLLELNLGQRRSSIRFKHVENREKTTNNTIIIEFVILICK